MNWEQKLDALNKLEQCWLRMIAPGDWAVAQDVDIRTFNKSVAAAGKGKSPDEAVEAHWKLLTELDDNQVCVSRPGYASRAIVRWNGLMWTPVSNSQPAELKAQSRPTMPDPPTIARGSRP